MWAVSPIVRCQCNRPFALTVSVNIPSPRRRVAVFGAEEDVGVLGHSVLSAVNPYPDTVDPIPIPQTAKHNQQKQKQEKRKKETAEDGKQLSGSDVLWALQRATAHKKQTMKNKKKKKGLSSPSNQREENIFVDYSDVKPLSIKRDWAVRLDELEKRLQELSDVP